MISSLQWRHNERDGVSNHHPHDCLRKRLFGSRSKKTPKLRVTGLCAGNSPVTGEFPAQRASYAENVSIWWRHHVRCPLKSRFSKAPVTHSLQPVGDLLATKISGGCREVAGWLQGGRRPVADRLQTVAGTIWSQGGFGCCKWNLSATKSIVERFLVVADGLPTGRRLVGDWSPTSCSGCRQSRHSF